MTCGAASPFEPTALPWASWWDGLRGRRCRAVREPRPVVRSGSVVAGRCELVSHHVGDHALERGFDTPRWSTDWTDTPPDRPPPERPRFPGQMWPLA